MHRKSIDQDTDRNQENEDPRIPTCTESPLFRTKPVFLVGLLLCSSLYSKSSQFENFETTNPGVPGPWFTGPLLAPSPNTVPPKHLNLEPYVYFIASTGSYNERWHQVNSPRSYSVLSQNYLQIGITSFMDCQLVPQLFYRFQGNKRSTQAGDLPIQVGFQLLKDNPGSFQPSLKLCLKAAIPWGKYQNLHPNKEGLDGVGTGSWAPGISLNFGKLFSLSPGRFCSTRAVFGWTGFNAVSVTGLNVYGGTPDTKGTVYPGAVFSCDLAFEYSITRKWVFAADVYYVRENKTGFTGRSSDPESIGGPSSEQLSLAPAFEYNWSGNVGIITGAWFTVAGRNSGSFIGSVTAVNIYF